MGKETRGLWSPQCHINAVTAASATADVGNHNQSCNCPSVVHYQGTAIVAVDAGS